MRLSPVAGRGRPASVHLGPNEDEGPVQRQWIAAWSGMASQCLAHPLVKLSQ